MERITFDKIIRTRKDSRGSRGVQNKMRMVDRGVTKKGNRVKRIIGLILIAVSTMFLIWLLMVYMYFPDHTG